MYLHAIRKSKFVGDTFSLSRVSSGRLERILERLHDLFGLIVLLWILRRASTLQKSVQLAENSDVEAAEWLTVL